MKKLILTGLIFFMFFLKLFAQTPNDLPFLKDIKNPDLLKNVFFLNSVKYQGHINQSNDTGDSGKNLFILPEYESWLVWWNNYNYLSENKIKPALFHSPSLAIKYGKYTYKLSFQVAKNMSSIITASTKSASFISLQASSDLSYSKRKESSNFVFDSKIQYGRLKGKGAWSYYADKINFQEVYDTFNINSRSLMVSCMVNFNGRKPAFGLKYINYNTPAYMVGTDTLFYPDDPESFSLEVDIKDTKFNHFFLVVDPLALLSNVAVLLYDLSYENEPCTKKTEVKFQGHWYYMFGLGFAKNDTIGTVFTTSFPFQSYGNLREAGHFAGILENSFGSEFDLGVKITTRIGRHKNDTFTRIEEAAHFRTAIGLRYTNWSILSYIKNGLQLRSNELYWGPYLMLAFQF